MGGVGLSAYLSLIGRRRGGRLLEAGRLLNFSAFRMGAYSRWALIRGWALIRINTVVKMLQLARMSNTCLAVFSTCHIFHICQTLPQVKFYNDPQNHITYHAINSSMIIFLPVIIINILAICHTLKLLSPHQASQPLFGKSDWKNRLYQFKI